MPLMKLVDPARPMPMDDLKLVRLKPGKYDVEVETKATGALEKEKYANFHSGTPSAVFVRQVLDVTEASVEKPFVIQAVPHIYITGQCYNPQGEITRCHLPQFMGQFDGQPLWINSKEGKQVGAFQLMVPHGVENVRLSFTTNEHTGLTVQFPGEKPSTQTTYTYKKLEEGFDDIKVVRYVAPILQVTVLDVDGKQVNEGRVHSRYLESQPKPQMMMGMERQLSYFRKQDDGVHRSSSLVPDVEMEIFAVVEGYESERNKITMKEGATEKLTLRLKPGKKDTSDTEKKRD